MVVFNEALFKRFLVLVLSIGITIDAEAALQPEQGDTVPFGFDDINNEIKNIDNRNIEHAKNNIVKVSIDDNINNDENINDKNDNIDNDNNNGGGVTGDDANLQRSDLLNTTGLGIQYLDKVPGPVEGQNFVSPMYPQGSNFLNTTRLQDGSMIGEGRQNFVSPINPPKGSNDGATTMDSNANPAMGEKVAMPQEPSPSVDITLVKTFLSSHEFEDDEELRSSFFYPVVVFRRVFFLFFCPLIYNSFLNFIFEIDNKLSGKYVTNFSFGFRSRHFLHFISFDLDFNILLFLASSFFDIYCINSACRKFANAPGFGIKCASVLFYSILFNAVSLCVNFKVDDYFYITINLSYFIRKALDKFVSSLCNKNNNVDEANDLGDSSAKKGTFTLLSPVIVIKDPVEGSAPGATDGNVGSAQQPVVDQSKNIAVEGSATGATGQAEGGSAAAGNSEADGRIYN